MKYFLNIYTFSRNIERLESELLLKKKFQSVEVETIHNGGV